MRRLGPIVLLAAALAASCKNVSPPGAFFDTEPPGAEVIVDGQPSGFVTPCLIRLDGGKRYVRLELPGYEPRQVLLEPADRKARVPWRDGAVAPNGLRTVFALESEDIWVPYRIDDSPSPRRIFLRLEPVARSESIATP